MYIVKQLPQMVNKRISDLSCDKPEFDKAKTIYKSALKSSGYETTMKFDKDNRNNQNTNRKRKIIWFNPPFNQQVKTKLVKLF